MGFQKDKKPPLVPSRKGGVKGFNLVALGQMPEGLLILSMEGEVLAINDAAANILKKPPEKITQRPFWNALKITSFSTKKQWLKTKRAFRLATYGHPQQLTWIEPTHGKPAFAYDILMFRTEIDDMPVIMVQIKTSCDEKIRAWVLRTLAAINHRASHSETIDKLLQLSNQALNSTYSFVMLTNSLEKASTLSIIHQDSKKNNIRCSLQNNPLMEALGKQNACYVNHITERFPQVTLFKKFKARTCFAGALYRDTHEMCGFYAVVFQQDIEQSPFEEELFGIILNRLRAEIRFYLNENELKLLADIPKEYPDPIIKTTYKGEVLFANAEGKKLIKLWEKQFNSLPNQLIQEIKATQNLKQPCRFEFEVQYKTYLFSLTRDPLMQRITILGTDVSQLKNSELNMMNLAHYDALTKIANRQYFEELVTEKIIEHERANKELAILIIDLDNFKTINDTLGHLIGDKLLKASSQRMARCLRATDYIARMGGDEFVVFLGYTTTEATKAVAEKIISVLSRIYKFGDSQIKITASVGIAMFPDGGISLNTLMKNADVAMYQAKKLGKNSYMVFSPSLQTIQERRDETLRTDIKTAVPNEELILVYQPQIDIINQNIVGIESYLHWEHPHEGLILPGEFIRLAEQTGCIRSISQWLIERCLKDFVGFLNINKDIKLSLNVSLIQLNDNYFMDFLIQQIQSSKLKRAQIEIDISERSIAPHFKQITQHLKKIHKLGIGTCIDNFGSPQVSLPKLLALPIDILKLDQQLLERIDKNEKHRMLLKGVIRLAQALHIEVLQKGVETSTQDRIIKSMGCKFAQGYYYCKPIRAPAMADFLKAGLK